MTVLSWVLTAAVVWIVLAAVVGLVVGAVIRNRDRQIPTDVRPAPPAAPVVERKS